jgi:hypothetical protein
MQKSASTLGLVTAVATLVGCATNVSPTGEATDAEVSTTATAIVVVEGSTANDGSHASAVARFVKARSGIVDDDALRMVGATVDFPAIGACASLAPNRAAPGRTLALLDVGAVSLSASDVAIPLARRQLPDVADLVSGVVYSARADGVPARSAYTLRVEGSPDLDVAPFMVTAASPGEPADLRVAGEDGRDGRRGPISLAVGSPTEITWESPLAATDDLVYVDVTSTSSVATARCLFPDAGRASIPSAAFGLLDEGTLAVHRLHREAFSARGVDPGEVRFDFARVVSFVRH